MSFFFAKNRQVLHRYSEQGKAHGDNHESDGKFGPLRHVVMADVSLKASDADIEAVGDESQHCRDGRQIQELWRQPDLLETEHRDGYDEGQRQLEPEKISRSEEH